MIYAHCGQRGLQLPRLSLGLWHNFGARIISCLVALICISCEQTMPTHSLPFAPVSLQVDTDGFDHDLRGALSTKTITSPRTPQDRLGIGGILLVRDGKGDNLFAYDLCCPHEKKAHIRVEPTDDGKAICPHCGSVFVTMFGTGYVESGSATAPLQRYTVTPLNNHQYSVRN